MQAQGWCRADPACCPGDERAKRLRPPLRQGETCHGAHQIWSCHLREQCIARWHHKGLHAAHTQCIDKQNREREFSTYDNSDETRGEQSRDQVEDNQQAATIVLICYRSAKEDEQERGEHHRALSDPHPFCLGVQLANHEPGEEYTLHAHGSKPRADTGNKPAVGSYTAVALRRRGVLRCALKLAWIK